VGRHALIYENGELMAESPRFSGAEEIIFADIDLERMVQERSRLSSYTDTIERS
jgi:NAD+ synthase (glutamine-hydrolysing)